MRDFNIETKRQKEAFEYFYSLGSQRSFNKVGDYIGVANTTIKGWAHKYEWLKRVEERDHETAIQLKNKKDDDFVLEMEANRKLIREGLADFIKRLKSGEIKVNRIKDAIDLLKLDAVYVDIILKLKNDKRLDENTLNNMINFTITTSDIENKQK